MLNKSLLLALTAILSIATSQIGCSATNVAPQSTKSSGGVPMNLQRACIDEAARLANISSSDIHLIGSTDLGNGKYDVNLMLGARQGVCTVDSQGKVLSVRGEGKVLP